MRTIEQRTIRSTMFGFVQFGLTFVQSILLVPLLLSNWGEEKYAIYIGIFAFIQVLRTIDFGHQAFVGNEFNKEYFQDKNKAATILASSIKMALILGGVEFALFLGLWTSGVAYSLLGLSQGDSPWIMVGILCMVFMWWIVGSVAGILARAVLTKNLYAETVLWAILLKTLEIVFLVIAGVINMSLFHLLLIWALINLIYTFLALRWTLNKLPEIRHIWQLGTWRQAILNLKNSVILTFNNGFEQLNTNGIIFLITHYISLALLPVFITLRTLTNTAILFTGLILNPLQPDLIRFHSEKSGDKVYSVIQTVWIINGMIVNISLLFIMPFISWLYLLWTKNLLPFNKELFFLLSMSVAVVNFGKGLIVYLTGINDLKAITFMAFSRCLIIFTISFLFIGHYGLLSIGFAFLIAELVSSIALPVYFIKHKLSRINFSIKTNDIFLAVVPLCILGLSFMANLLWDYGSYLIASLGIAFMLIIYFIQWNRLDQSVQLRLKLVVSQILKRKQNSIVPK